MKVQILVRGNNVEVTRDLRAHVENRVGTALGRFGDRIGGVVVRFSGPEGSAEADGTRCEIQVSLRPRSVRVEGTDKDLSSVFDQVSSRIARSIARAIEREQDLDLVSAPSVAARRLDR
jgi:ribosomal subunit interface protein